uniref:Uncharacterized protein n=1 Tax=Panagrolaimus davidi TaxID=227884 RepID=A0A914PZ64_9BILA
MPINRSSSAVYLQGDVRSKLPHAYSSSNLTATNLTAWTTQPYNPSWRCSRPYDEYSRTLDNYVPYYHSRYFA